jgi:surfeit locus 1 family protein
MEYRSVTVRGEYDPSQEVLLRNQVWEDRLGFHVLTPLVIEGSEYAVLVDRGWIPFDQADREMRGQFAEPGVVQISGTIRRGQGKPDFGGVPDPTLQPGQTRLDAWNVVNLSRIQEQSNLKLLPVYVQQAPDSAWSGLPYRSLPEIELSEGSHLSYAIQWFTFAAILAAGYPIFLRRQLSGRRAADVDLDDRIAVSKAG